MFQNMVISIGGMVVQHVVNGYGFLFVAGFTATNKLYGILEMAAISYGYAIVSYTGQNLGAQRTDRILEGVRARKQDRFCHIAGSVGCDVSFGQKDSGIVYFRNTGRNSTGSCHCVEISVCNGRVLMDFIFFVCIPFCPPGLGGYCASYGKRWSGICHACQRSAAAS